MKVKRPGSTTVEKLARCSTWDKHILEGENQ